MALPGLDGIPLAKLFEKAKSRGIVTSLDVTWDSSGNWFSKIQSVLEHTDFFFPSYQEAVHISGKYDIDDITAFFNNFGFTLFGVKLGSKGLYLTDFSSQWKIPPISSNVIDTTGAGDACVAGLLAGIIKKLSPSLCGKLGSLTASECISHYGATEPSKDLTYLWSKIDE
jgi:sugar/nucleoside kinase (ribokinase family)